MENLISRNKIYQAHVLGSVPSSWQISFCCSLHKLAFSWTGPSSAKYYFSFKICCNSRFVNTCIAITVTVSPLSFDIISRTINFSGTPWLNMFNWSALRICVSLKIEGKNTWHVKFWTTFCLAFLVWKKTNNGWIFLFPKED